MTMGQGADIRKFERLLISSRNYKQASQDTGAVLFATIHTNTETEKTTVKRLDEEEENPIQ